MTKYIDAEKLKGEIESRMEDCKLPDGKFPTKTNAVRYEELLCFHNYIDSLQQEETCVDLDKVLSYLDSVLPNITDTGTVNWIISDLKKQLMKTKFKH